MALRFRSSKAGCAGSRRPGRSDRRRGLLTQFATASTATSKASGVLVIDSVHNSRLMDPQRENSSSANIALHAMYDTLVTFKGTDYSKVLPDLATRGRSRTTASRSPSTSGRASCSPTDAADGEGRRVQLRALDQPQGREQLAARRRHELQRQGQVQGDPHLRHPNPALLRIAGPRPRASSTARRSRRTAAPLGERLDRRHGRELDHDELRRQRAVHDVGVHRRTRRSTSCANPKYWGPKPRFEKVVIRSMPTRGRSSSTSSAARVRSRSTSRRSTPANLKGEQVRSRSSAARDEDLLHDGQPEAGRHGGVEPAAPWRRSATASTTTRSSRSAARLPTRLAGMIPDGLLGALPPTKAIQQDLPRAKAASRSTAARTARRASTSAT